MYPAKEFFDHFQSLAAPEKRAARFVIKYRPLNLSRQFRINIRRIGKNYIVFKAGRNTTENIGFKNFNAFGRDCVDNKIYLYLFDRRRIDIGKINRGGFDIFGNGNPDTSGTGKMSKTRGLYGPFNARSRIALRAMNSVSGRGMSTRLDKSIRQPQNTVNPRRYSSGRAAISLPLFEFVSIKLLIVDS